MLKKILKFHLLCCVVSEYERVINSLPKSLHIILGELEVRCCLVNCRKSLCQRMLVVENATNYPHPARQVEKRYDEGFNSHIFKLIPLSFYLLCEGQQQWWIYFLANCTAPFSTFIFTVNSKVQFSLNLEIPDKQY